jgi:H+/gluconate symporter-like permease
MLKRATRRGRPWLWIALVLALGAAPAHALAPPEPEQNLCARAFRASFDLILLRPMGVISTLFGSAVYAVLLPVTWPLDGEPAAREPLVVTPFYETFQRPLGEW